MSTTDHEHRIRELEAQLEQAEKDAEDLTRESAAKDEQIAALREAAGALLAVLDGHAVATFTQSREAYRSLTDAENGLRSVLSANPLNKSGSGPSLSEGIVLLRRCGYEAAARELDNLIDHDQRMRRQPSPERVNGSEPKTQNIFDAMRDRLEKMHEAGVTKLEHPTDVSKTDHSEG